MRKIIDFHTHPFISEKEVTCFYPDGLEFTSEFFRKDLKNAGITVACGTVISFEKIRIGKVLTNVSSDRNEADGFEPFRRLNREALHLKKQYGDFYIPGVHVHPEFIQESCDELEYRKSQGVMLVGELVPYLHDWSDYSSKGFSEILDTIGQLGMVVSFHSMDDKQMDVMVKNHPEVTFVAAHPGDREKYALHLERMRRYPNVYLDLSGTGLFRYGMLKHGVNTVGAERFVFGTDYPITNPYMYVKAVEFEKIREEEKEMIFYKNAERILGME